MASNNTRVTHYMIDQESSHAPSVFKFIYNVTDPNVTSVVLNLPGWASLRFRVRAVNNVGPSRPSVSTAKGVCTTPVGGMWIVELSHTRHGLGNIPESDWFCYRLKYINTQGRARVALKIVCLFVCLLVCLFVCLFV